MENTVSKAAIFSGICSMPSGKHRWADVASKAFDGVKLKDKFCRGVDANHALGIGTEHAPAVIAIAAADIENGATF